METTTSYEPKVRISATVEKTQLQYLNEMAADLGLRGYGEALRELLDRGIAAREQEARA